MATFHESFSFSTRLRSTPILVTSISTRSPSFIHTGGWLFVHDNNSIEINLLECIEKEDFGFDKLDNLQQNETESAAGRVAASLQQKSVKLLQRRR